MIPGGALKRRPDYFKVEQQVIVETVTQCGTLARCRRLTVIDPLR
jgi:hypothetical protein